ncbi:L7Ae/L30e/S12e/Gadd45 family ribosomal protein [Spiroplasma tabanidicola]|uniref:Putative 50S ribosomal protein L7Ae n=1 Tax=Spiroplasma tabanidicola TaxID=324079 RepID=A0A6I6C8N3_9MOLU|nr:ribosomal L7Ae/L30e/S12e/Gadd45 family protein [Spiroplasma tabanidicola]QGS51819.1 putative 50S ribosomal protein L7Ae [Spiroplasma tabanidicola]
MEDLLKTLGLVSSARQIISGESLFKKIQQQKVRIVLTTSDMGKSQLKKINDKCNFYQIPIYNGLFNSDDLNKAIGKNNIKAIGVESINFAKLLINKISKGDV